MSPDRQDPRPEETKTPATPAESPTAPAHTDPIEDANTQALSETLRSSLNIVKALMGVLVVAFIASGVFTVEPNRVAVKLRFGRPVGLGQDQLLQPGLHWKLPYPIDEVVFIPVGETRTISSTTGWYYQTPEQIATDTKPGARPTLTPGVDGYTLTSDGNIIHARATLSYRITDPVAFEFGFANATNLLQHILNNALIYASSRFTADDAIYGEKVRFQEVVLNQVRAAIEKTQLGVSIDPQEVLARPPLFVETAFDDVIRAQQQGNVLIQEAHSYSRGATNRAAAEASVIVQDGITRSNLIVVSVSAEADRFMALLPDYERNPELLEKRLLAETMQRVLTNAQFTTYLPARSDGKERELRLMLNKPPEVAGRKPAAQTQQD